MSLFGPAKPAQKRDIFWNVREIKSLKGCIQVRKELTQTRWFLSSNTWKKSYWVTFYPDLNISFIFFRENICTYIFRQISRIILTLMLMKTITNYKQEFLVRYVFPPAIFFLVKSSLYFSCRIILWLFLPEWQNRLEFWNRK